MAKSNRNLQPGRLRIVAGNWRSRVLRVADAPGLRPTGERIRETLFNWLSTDIVGARCLDLFAGSGALGLEALSRGAASTCFVERSRRVANVLESNITELDADNATIVVGDAFRYLAEESTGPFDIVFLDPPFADDSLQELCRLVASRGILGAGAKIYLEMHKRQPMPVLPQGWRISKDKTSGDVRYALADTRKD